MKTVKLKNSKIQLTRHALPDYVPALRLKSNDEK